jgi:uncharacterized protein (UPF0276 family)
MLDQTARDTLPARPGVGYKPRHFAHIIDDPRPVAWLEIHAENYMGAGGRPLAQLRHLAERFPMSVHGVGLSIGGEGALDRDHLARLKHLCGWLNPASFSEHLAWSTHDTEFLNDLLPLPYTAATLARVAAHIDEVQETVGRRMLLENPSVYLDFAETDLDEIDFLTEIAGRTGCGLLLDVSNAHVSCTNHGRDALAYIHELPLAAVAEVHLAGFARDHDAAGAPLLIDHHGSAVDDAVWVLYAHVIAALGSVPTLLERDHDVPALATLLAEAGRADQMMVASGEPRPCGAFGGAA